MPIAGIKKAAQKSARDTRVEKSSRESRTAPIAAIPRTAAKRTSVSTRGRRGITKIDVNTGAERPADEALKDEARRVKMR
jgi:hypothetical protein